MVGILVNPAASIEESKHLRSSLRAWLRSRPFFYWLLAPEVLPLIALRLLPSAYCFCFPPSAFSLPHPPLRLPGGLLYLLLHLPCRVINGLFRIVQQFFCLILDILAFGPSESGDRS